MDVEKKKFLAGLRVEEIDPISPTEEYARFVNFLERTDHAIDHYLRYCLTFALMLKHGFQANGKNVLETGNASPITHFLPELGAEASETHGDLRYRVESDDQVADVVLSFEVMEHIKDRTEQSFSEVGYFNESGVRNFASEIVRILKPGGVLFLTTPNAASLYSIMEALKGAAPMVYRPHVREYNFWEVQQIFSALPLEAHETHYPFWPYSFATRRLRDPILKKIFSDQGYSPENRGDLHFFKFRKPSATT